MIAPQKKRRWWQHHHQLPVNWRELINHDMDVTCLTCSEVMIRALPGLRLPNLKPRDRDAL